MQTIKEIHDKAMNLAEDAFHAQKSGREADAIRLFAEALELEQEAANSLPLSEESEPTRSILFRSAASLAFNSKNYEVADRFRNVNRKLTTCANRILTTLSHVYNSG